MSDEGKGRWGEVRGVGYGRGEEGREGKEDWGKV